ncbi:MAG: biopolymer transporter ExbD [Verrucomicrobia bacterium]|nr:biopolymer transporter ExbD [Verrucomicrobiota bacterium]
MKFSRNAKIFRGQLDAAPFAGVFFLFVIFLVLASLVYTPGVRIQLPAAADLAGTDHPTIAVAVDKNGQLYFENQLIQEAQLKNRLKAAVQKSTEPLTLVVLADVEVKYTDQVRLLLLAREVGIKEALLATRPRAFASSPAGPTPP